MTLRSRYDPREDRMLLTLRVRESDQQFWVTRRLWLAIYQRLGALVSAGPEDEAAPPPPKPPRPIAPEDSADAALLQDVRFQRAEEGVRLMFVGGPTNVNVTLREPGIARWKRMFEVQADRAGWDTAAATERLRASALAGAALQRARQ